MNIERYATFNRTTLELKWICIEFARLNKNPFNRTTLELKYYVCSYLLTMFFLLIVPHWNWNFTFEDFTSEQITAFNRTTLELKFHLASRALGEEAHF